MYKLALGIIGGSAVLRGGSIMEHKSTRIKSFLVHERPDVVFRAILRFAWKEGYRGEAMDQTAGRVVLGDSDQRA
jgi:hypothetical protein